MMFACGAMSRADRAATASCVWFRRFTLMLKATPGPLYAPMAKSENCAAAPDGRRDTPSSVLVDVTIVGDIRAPSSLERALLSRYSAYPMPSTADSEAESTLSAMRCAAEALFCGRPRNLRLSPAAQRHRLLGSGRRGELRRKRDIAYGAGDDFPKYTRSAHRSPVFSGGRGGWAL